MVYDTQTRATFNDTKQAQEKLRQRLDKYEENNLFLNPKDRESFFEILADALLGLDYEKNCILRLPDETNSIYIKNLGEFIRYLGYYNKNEIDDDFLRHYGIYCKKVFPISALWRELKFIVYGIFPEALGMSIRISKEREKKEKSEGASIETIQRPSKH
jgi:hypothetical protein